MTHLNTTNATVVLEGELAKGRKLTAGSGITFSDGGAGGNLTISASGGSTRVVYASKNGAALDSNLASGGGTDDTTALQTLLNLASDGTPLMLILDGPALVSGLDVYSHTTIWSLEGAGLFLKASSNRAILRNKNRSAGTRTDHDITIIGGYFNGNRANQTGSGSPATYESDGTPMVGIQMYGVAGLKLQHTYVVNTLSYGYSLANVLNVDGSDIVFDCLGSGATYLTTDGFNVNGNSQYITLRGLKLTAWDDSLAFNTLGTVHDGALGPYIDPGPISDVLVDGVEFVGSLQGLRLYATDQRIDRVVVSNVTGSVHGYAGVLDYFDVLTGDFGSVTLDNWDVALLAENSDTVSEAYINFNAAFESLTLRNIKMNNAIDSRPLLWFHSGADVDMLDIDGFIIYDPSNVVTKPILIDGGHIGRLSARMAWLGSDVDEDTNPVVLENGGTVDRVILISAGTVTLDANADAVLSLTGQEIGLDTQTAGRFLAGPVSGAAAAPTFRAFNAVDLGTGSEGSGDKYLADNLTWKTAAGLSGKYRQWLYSASGGDLTILTDADGNPLSGLCDLE